MPVWTAEFQERALKDGWGVFENSDHGLRIERFDEAGRFDSDAAAQAYVGMCAVLGGDLACEAFKYLAYSHAVSDAAEQG